MARFLVVLDVDSTLIENEVIELFAAEAGSLAAVAEITDRAMNGELDFAESLQARVATLKGLPASIADAVRSRVSVTTGVPQMIAGIHAAGGKVGAVSGGFHEILDPIAASLGLDYWRANCLAVVDDQLTGEVSGDIVDAAAKASALQGWALDCGVPLSRTIAVGDGANDLAMMAVAGLSIGFDAKPAVRAAADVLIDTRDLSQVLPLLGLRG
ncbi:MAG: phosphoserine phosphatase SerB [Salinibacterium sp.]|nr:MAG: phosphoserine phosphatase SerB [Salinibacterium sp.]